MRRKRAQSGGSAAALIAVIGLIIVLYILLLPPDERAKLLDENGNSDNGNGGSSVLDNNLTLLTESPGRLDFLPRDEYEKSISPVYLYRTAESTELKQVSSLEAKNGVFDKSAASFEFSVADMDNTDDLLLSFAVEEYSGTLSILLNGKSVYQGEISGSAIEPISLPLDYLSRKNELVFAVSGVGWQFWKTNRYILKNIRIIGEVTDTSRQESRNSFMIADVEFFNIDSATLKFNPECVPAETGMLEVYMNKELIFSGVPDCGSLTKRELAPTHLKRGENTLVFRTRRGNYLIDNIDIVTKLKEKQYPSYYFELNETVYGEIRNGTLDAFVTLDFFDDDELKQGIIYVNGRVSGFSTYEDSIEKRITHLLEEDNNAIKIVPDRTVLEVRRVKVFLEEIEDDD